MWATIVLIVLLAAGAWWYVSNSSAPAPEPVPVAAEPTPPAPVPDTAGVSGDASDAGLNGDLQTIDSHVDAAATAGASANSFTDTPVQQTE